MIKLIKKIKIGCLNTIYSAEEFLETLRPEVELNLEFHGSGVGRKEIYAEKFSEKSIIYSFGIGLDPSFDLSLIEKYDVKIYAFDPTPGVKEWIATQNHSENFKFYSWGLGAINGAANFYPKKNAEGFTNHSLFSGRAPDVPPVTVPIKKLSTIVSELGHNKIDLLKMDIEGSEIEVLPQILAMDIEIDQLHIEFHETKYYEPYKTVMAVKQLREAGYKLCSIHKRDLTFVK